MSYDPRQRELGVFLRAHREQIKPEEVGLPTSPRRRTPGLRREEVATLAGLGLAWYTWLEQGKVTASRQVLEAIARALRLDDDARRHALTLSGLYTSPDGDRHEQAVAHLRPVLERWTTSPALLLDRHFDVTAWNEAYAALWGDPGRLPDSRRNLLWLMAADPRVRAVLQEWESLARDVFAQFRAQAGLHPEDPRARAVLAALEQDVPHLRHWWRCQTVREFPSRTVTFDSTAGQITLVVSPLRPADDPEALILLQTPATETDHARLAVLVSRGPGERREPLDAPAGQHEPRLRPGQVPVADQPVVLAEPDEDGTQHPRDRGLRDPLVQPG
ncbi:helix-turn-helix domain protein [Parafrankia sp. EUN1f]|nr:helix-turn-helix domain-containing protein [Parafrankia sp. EUN1f]EFC83400.1 helix-turn-helix domain protein [Parafrankia sp. EUN1f]